MLLKFIFRFYFNGVMVEDITQVKLHQLIAFASYHVIFYPLGFPFIGFWGTYAMLSTSLV